MPCVIIVEVVNNKSGESPHIKFPMPCIVLLVVDQRIKLRGEPLLSEWCEIVLFHKSVSFSLFSAKLKKKAVFIKNNLHKSVFFRTFAADLTCFLWCVKGNKPYQNEGLRTSRVENDNDIFMSHEDFYSKRQMEQEICS